MINLICLIVAVGFAIVWYTERRRATRAILVLLDELQEYKDAHAGCLTREKWLREKVKALEADIRAGETTQ